MNELWITLPNNFGKRYKKYKASLGFTSTEASIVPQKTDEYTNNDGADHLSQNDTQDKVNVQTQHGSLTLNKDTGDFRFNDTSGNLNPSGQEFTVLLKLMTSKNYKANYVTLITGNVSKSSKRSLTFIIRNLKTALGILPVKDAKNEDIFGNIPNVGYKLLI